MTLTLAQVTADYKRAAADIEERLAPVVAQAAINIAEQARANVRRSKAYPLTASDNDPQEYAARNLGFTDRDPDDLDVVVGYSDDVTSLGRAIEFGTTTAGPGGQIGTATNAELPRFAKVAGKVGAAVWRS